MGAHAEQQVVRLQSGTVQATEARAFAVAEMRRLADALESGKLRGAHVQWVENCARVVVVEVDPWCKRCDANIVHECKQQVRMLFTEVEGRSHDLRGDPLEATNGA